MNVLSSILLVLFIIVAVLLVLIVLVQNEEGDSLGGVFAGGSSSAFGSRSGTILSKATSVLGGIFLVLSLALAVVNRTPGSSGVERAGRQNTGTENADWWRPTEESADTTSAPSADTTPSEAAAE
jgi:preprotein translocase subunit SecG